ncbi:MAG: zinc ribbon domain-containing protein [Bacillota bacterium]
MRQAVSRGVYSRQFTFLRLAFPPGVRVEDVPTIVPGNLKDVLQGKDWRESVNQELHAWPFARFREMFTCKAALRGLSVETVSERETACTCSICSKKEPYEGAGRKERGRYMSAFRGMDTHADINGAANVLKRYLHEREVSGVVASLARPAVSRFRWRDTTPFVREAGKPRQSV